MGMYGFSAFFYLIELALGPSVLFFRSTQIALFWPIMTIMLLIVSFTNYSACSALTSSNFTGTSAATATQYNSCTGGSSAEYGDSGTIAKKVADDPYLIWTSVGAVSILAYTRVAFTAQGKMADYFYSQIIDKSEGPPAENA